MQFAKFFETLDQKQKNIIVGLAVFLVLFLICYKIIYKTAIKKEAYYKTKVQELTAQNDLRQQIQRLDETKLKNEELIVQKTDLDRIKNDLSKLASDSGAGVVSISSVKKPDSAGYNTFTTTMELRCNYHRLGNFISKIENSQPYIKITSVNIQNAESGYFTRGAAFKPQPEGEALANVNLVVETYSLRK